ncbi:NAD-dependent epimerase/dehydratase family protein [Bradyrhizobium sp. BR 1433]|uniref:NAD-dependent epimerase/dehydratase family protein n=1 Tax=Bradyrhizobium sp. BR 1433 TaxID=3447967 RepID=UPI003EE4D561
MTVALVTGANGFLGRYVRRELINRGIEVIGLCRSHASADPRSVLVSERPTPCELRALVNKVQPSTIFHLAGTARAGSLEDLYQANVFFAIHLLEAALSSAQRLPTVVLAGSAAEYGRSVHRDCIVRETDPCTPLSLYGASKLCQTYHGLFAHARGLPVVVARLFNPIGPGAPRTTALGSFVSQLSASSPHRRTLKTGSLNAVRDFVNVVDVARALVDLADTPGAAGQIVNVCSGSGRTVQHVVDRLISVAGAPIAHEIEPTRRGTSDIETIIGDTARLRQLGVVIPPPDVDAILREMLSVAMVENGG